VDQREIIEPSSLWRLALDHLAGQQVLSLVQQLEDVTIGDLFRLLERLTSLVKHTELRRVQNLLVELKIVRDNTMLQNSSAYEAKIIRIIQKSGRLGEFVSTVLTKSIKSG
jgi:hypothetical protein